MDLADFQMAAAQAFTDDSAHGEPSPGWRGAGGGGRPPSAPWQGCGQGLCTA